MAHHLIDISAAQCSITCRDGQLICRADNEPEKRAPMEDIGAIIVNSFSAFMHNRVFLEAAKNGTIIIFCENFKPTALLLPANRATDTLLTRGQISLESKLRKALWLKTLTAKCVNQAAFAQHSNQRANNRATLSPLHGQNVPTRNRNAPVLTGASSPAFCAEDFRRRRDQGGLNSMLNYGYAVLLARILQKMIAVGLDPTFGIGHVVRERATPLAYDLMEPFRVLVDARALAWADNLWKEADSEEKLTLEVTPEYKRWILGFLTQEIPYQKKKITAENVMEHVLRGFRSAVCAKRLGLYRPWTLEDTKWDGF